SDPWRQIYLVRTDKDGNIKWQKEYGSSSLNDNGRDIVETPDGGFICSGYVRYPYITSDFFVRGQILKIDSLGNLVWYREHSALEYNQAFIEIKKALDGNYLISGDYSNNRYVLTSDPNGTGGVLLKIDGDGNTLWFRRYGDEIFDASCYDFVELPNGDIATIGFDSKGRSTLVKFNKYGDILWKKQYRHNTNRESPEALFTIIHTKDNGFFMSGYGFPLELSTPLSIAKGWVLKVDSVGCQAPCVVSTHEETGDPEVIVYPNPFIENLWVKLPVNHDYHTLRIYDIASHNLYSLDLRAEGEVLYIDGNKFEKGIYFVELLSDKNRFSKKVIKME
ncbi:MAG: T9SS type A sorting domain-containing protein, partial [Saprospiraceae bacterium]|nr:T9SS type A sorting domain-containing protein [Saprospiraceae bacterium]